MATTALLALAAPAAAGVARLPTPPRQQAASAPQDAFEELFQRGARAFDAGDDAAAERALRQALQLRPGEVRATALLGNVLRRGGRAADAVELLRAAVEEAPAYYPARVWYGQTLLQLGRLDAAIEHLRVAIDLAPREAAPHAFLAQALLRADDLDEAAAQARELVRLAPAQAAAHSLLATIELRRGRADEALTAYRRALELSDDPTLRLGEASALAALGRDKDALETLTAVLEKAPDKAEAWSLFARVLARSGPPPEALVGAAQFYREALRLRPGHPGDTLALAELYRRLGLFRQGLELLDGVEETAWQGPQAWLLRGMLAAKAGRYEEARDALERAIALGAGAEAWYERGIVAVNLADPRGAARAFARASEVQPDHGAAWRELGRVKLQLNEPEEALAALGTAARLLPKDPTTHLLRGQALQRLERQEEAIRAFEEALRLQPRNEQALYALATALGRAGQAERSRELLQRLSDIRRERSDAASVRADKAAVLLRDATLRLRLGYVDDAIGLLQQALQVDPDNAEALFQLGVAHARRGELQEAIEALESSAALQERAATWSALAQVYEQAGRTADARRARDRAARLQQEQPERG